MNGALEAWPCCMWLCIGMMYEVEYENSVNEMNMIFFVRSLAEVCTWLGAAECPHKDKDTRWLCVLSLKMSSTVHGLLNGFWTTA